MSPSPATHVSSPQPPSSRPLPQPPSSSSVGEHDTQTILDNGFRAQHFHFFDLTTRQPVLNNNPFPGTCNPHDALTKTDVVELHAAEAHQTALHLSDTDPLSDPVRQLQVGHEYAIRLVPQRIRCYEMSVVELFGGRKYLSIEELPAACEVVLECDTELRLSVRRVN